MGLVVGLLPPDGLDDFAEEVETEELELSVVVGVSHLPSMLQNLAFFLSIMLRQNKLWVSQGPYPTVQHLKGDSLG